MKFLLVYIPVFFFLNIRLVHAQEKINLTLENALDVATTKSLASLKANNAFLADHWEYYSYKANLLPFIGFKFTPIDYNSSWVERYDVENNVDVFREQKSFQASGQLYVSQKITATGGEIAVVSGLSKLENINNSAFSNYNAIPVQLVYEQSLIGFNKLKWDKKIEPLRYTVAKQTFIKDYVDISITTIDHYFTLMLEQTKFEIATKNALTSDTLYIIGQRKFKLSSIPQDELLNLKLNKYKADIELTQAKSELKKAIFKLNSFLGFRSNTAIEVSIPEFKFPRHIDNEKAIQVANLYHPKLKDLYRKNLEADRNLEEAKRNSTVNADLQLSLGFNKSDVNFNNLYTDLGQSQSQNINIAFTVPIADWGVNKGKRLTAEKQKEVATIEAIQEKIDFEQEVTLRVIEYNLQSEIVNSSKISSEISEKAYQLTKKKFLVGESDVFNLNNAFQSLQVEKEKYVRAIYTLWKMYYSVQQYTLYDFAQDKPISRDFETVTSSR